MVGLRVTNFGDKTLESSDHNNATNKIVTTKRCACGSCRNDSRYPQSWKRNSNGDPVTFFHFMAQLDKMRDGKGGLLHVIAVTRSFVRRMVTFAEYTLLMETDRLVREPCCRGDK